MAFYSHVLRNVRQVLFRDADQHAIPSMDGPLSPNSELDAFAPVFEALTDVDDVIVGPDDCYVANGHEIVSISRVDGSCTTIARFEAPCGALALHPDYRVLACVAGTGLAAVRADGGIVWLTQVGDAPLSCLTAVAVAPDGAIVVADGSTRHPAADWLWDLMEKNASGRIVTCNARLEEARVVFDRLAWPHGVAFSADGRSLWFSESWSHRVSRVSWPSTASGAREIVIGNLPGYPARLSATADGGFWLALFALRTHLVELVLTDDGFREEMMATIPPELWIAPQYASGRSYLEPLQGGGMRKLGILKPWAPPRSYGFVGHIDGQGEFERSLQSRVGGRNHGIVSVVEIDGELLVVSKARDQVLGRQDPDGQGRQ
ncbi:MAG: SMP-30/gluconolactonase/LRE family protein [Burkholderiaceae bacterium]